MKPLKLIPPTPFDPMPHKTKRCLDEVAYTFSQYQGFERNQNRVSGTSLSSIQWSWMQLGLLAKAII